MLSNLFAGLADRRAAGLVVIVLLVCVVDFVQRVQPDIDANALNRDAAELAAIEPPAAYQVSSRVSDWLAGLNAAAVGQEQPTEAAKQDLLSGGIDIGEKRVRVRAILIANTTQQRVALIEAQDREQRNVEFVELRQGDTLSGYTVSAVQVDGVAFTANTGDGATVRVKVFE